MNGTVRAGNKRLVIPEPNGKSFSDRAIDVYNDSSLDPATKENKLFALYIAEFMDNPIRRNLAKLYPKPVVEEARQYAVGKIVDLNKGQI